VLPFEWGVPVEVDGTAAVVDVLPAVETLPSEELEDTLTDELAFDDVSGARTIERGLCWVRA
jgi:hypothetical protein